VVSLSSRRCLVAPLIALLILVAIPTAYPAQGGSEGSPPRQRYWIPVTVESPGVVSVEVDLRSLESSLPAAGRLDPLTASVVGPDGDELRPSVQLGQLKLVDDVESGVDLWSGRKCLLRQSGDAAVGGGALEFRAGAVEGSWVRINIPASELASHSRLIFWGKGNFTAVLRDATLPQELGSADVVSADYRLVEIAYDPSQVSEKRPYALFLIPRDVTEVNYVDEVTLAGDSATFSWRAESPGEYRILLDTVSYPGPRDARLGLESGPEASFTVGEPGGFVVRPSISDGQTLSGVVRLEVRVQGNLSPIEWVQARLDYVGVGQGEWGDPSWGVLLNFTPAGGGSWVAEWDTAHTTWDGLHSIRFRAAEEGGRMAESEVSVWVWNVENGTRLDPDRTEFSFVVIGDNRPSGGWRQPEVYEQLLVDAVRRRPDLYFNVGDVVYSGEFREYVDFVRATSAIRGPLFIAMGNHEDSIGKEGQDNFLHFFGKLFYSFDYGNTHFVILNANVVGHRYTLSEGQIEWFERDLEEHSDAEHVFVFIHQPIYKYAHGLEDPSVESRLRQIVESHGVDCVFQGHEHMFYSGEEGGVRFFITGGGGAELDPQYPPDTLFFHYILVTVRGEEVSYEVVRPLVLELSDADEGVIVTHEGEFVVSGRTQPFARVLVDGEEVSPSSNGLFRVKVRLQPGMNEVRVRAEAEGESVERAIRILYRPVPTVRLGGPVRPGEELEVSVGCLGSPVPGAVVSLDGVEAATNASGRARLVVPQGEELLLEVHASGCQPYVEILYPEGGPVEGGGVELPGGAVVIAAVVIAAAAIAALVLRRRGRSPSPST